MCLICMKYRIILLIIIIISLDQILLSYIANTSRAHAQACTPPPFTLSLFDGSVVPNLDGPIRWQQCRSLAIEINTGGPVSLRFWGVFSYKKILGRTDTRTRERMYCQSIQFEISPETIEQELRPAVC